MKYRASSRRVLLFGEPAPEADRRRQARFAVVCPLSEPRPAGSRAVRDRPGTIPVFGVRRRACPDDIRRLRSSSGEAEALRAASDSRHLPRIPDGHYWFEKSKVRCFASVESRFSCERKAASDDGKFPINCGVRSAFGTAFSLVGFQTFRCQSEREKLLKRLPQMLLCPQSKIFEAPLGCGTRNPRRRVRRDSKL